MRVLLMDSINTGMKENSQKVYITEEEYNKINLKDRFWLVRKNTVNDKIFDT